MAEGTAPRLLAEGTAPICYRSGSYVDEVKGDENVCTDYGWPGRNFSTAKTRCGTCGAGWLEGTTPHNAAVRMPTHLPGEKRAGPPPVQAAIPGIEGTSPPGTEGISPWRDEHWMDWPTREVVRWTVKVAALFWGGGFLGGWIWGRRR